MKAASVEALKLAQDLHVQIATGQLDRIYADSDEGFKKVVTSEGSNALFSGVLRKLGKPLDCKQGNTLISKTTSGTFRKTECLADFSNNATGRETMQWRQVAGRYRLSGYFINSQELLDR